MKPDQRRPVRAAFARSRCLLAPLLLVLFATFGATMRPLVAQELEPLEGYLARLGLADLRAHLLERELAREANETIAKRLADVYAAQLVSAADDGDKFSDLMSRIETLMQQVPRARTPLLEVMLLQADYKRAEAFITAWLANQSIDQPRQEALEILQRIAPLLDGHQAELTKDVEKRLDEIDQLEAGAALQQAERELGPVQAVAGRAMYFAATSNYYLDLLSASPAGKGFQTARKLFRTLLGIDGEYGEYSASYLGLTSIWRARAVVGLALAEAALGNHTASNICFGWLTDSAVATAVRDQVPYWRLRAFATTGRFAELLEFARQQVAELRGSATSDKVSFCVGLVRTGFGSVGDSPEMRTIGMLGLAGLVKLRQLAAATQLLEEYRIEIDESAGFYLQWIQGQRLLERAEASGDSDDYQAAVEALANAVEQPESAGDLNAAAQCRAQLASCYVRLNNLERAARLFEQASAGLQASNDPAAAKSAWNAFLSYRTLSRTQPRFVASAVAVLNHIKREFPATSYAKDADYQIGKLRSETLTPAELLAQLAAVPADSDSYLAARYDVCATWFELWGQREGAAKQDALRELVDSADAYLEAAAGDPDLGRKVGVCLMVVQAASAPATLDIPLAERFLARARPFVDSLPAASRRVAEFHYRSLQTAQRQGDTAERDQHADWIVENARGSPFEVNALITVVKASEASLRTAAPAQKRAQTELAYRRWRRLAELLGTSSSKISTNKNARIASSKFAQYAAELGNHAEAAEVLDILLEVDGKNRSYLQRAGRANFQQGEYAASLQHWRTLLSGLEKGSEAWHEAKYYQLACLQQLDKAQFERVARQFQLLYPDLGPQPWRGKFAELLPR